MIEIHKTFEDTSTQYQDQPYENLFSKLTIKNTWTNPWTYFGVSFVTFNPFLANVPILYLLKTPENLWFSGVF